MISPDLYPEALVYPYDMESISAYIDSVLRLNDKYKFLAYFSAEACHSTISEILEREATSALPLPLRLVPISVKDIFCAEKSPISFGFDPYKQFMHGHDARIVAKLRYGGAICDFISTSAEFAVHSPPETLHPLDPDLYPGTSSTGSAVSVACGAFKLALGTQTSGSIIKPASYCSVFGFKPSFGLIPRTGVLLTAETLDTVGFVGANIESMEAALRLTSVSGHNYPYIPDIENNRYQGLRCSRVAFIKAPYPYPLPEKTALRLEPYLSLLRNYVHEYAEISIEASEVTSDIYGLQALIYSKALSYNLGRDYETYPESFSGVLAGLIQAGSNISSYEYEQALLQQDAYARHIDSIFESYDILIYPATMTAALSISKDDCTVSEIADINALLTMARVPIVSIPLKTDSSLPPMGVAIASKRYNDLALLQIASQIHSEILM